jgi:hypothetical protein
MWRGRDLHGGGESAPRKELLRNKICDQLYGRDVLGKRRSLQYTPSPLYISRSYIMQ